MRRSIVLISLFLMAGFLFHACAKPKNVRKDTRQSFLEAQTKNKTYQKKAAIVLKPLTATPFGRQAEDLFLRALIEEIRSDADRLKLVSAKDDSFPEFLKTTDPFSKDGGDFAVSEKARPEGYQYLLQAAVLNLVPEAKQTGFWWFRNTRYFFNVVVALNVYDTFTASKLFDQIETRTVKIEVDSYEDYVAGMPYDIERVNEMISDMAEELGKEAAKAISDGEWMASVIARQGNQIILAAGQSSGLQVGDRLAVFEGRRVISSKDGDSYIIPGYKLADIRITYTDPDSAQAAADSQAGIQPGDIAIPVK